MLFLNQLQLQKWYEPFTKDLLQDITETLLNIVKKSVQWQWLIIDVWFAVSVANNNIPQAFTKILDKQLQQALTITMQLPLQQKMWVALQLKLLAAMQTQPIAQKLSNKLFKEAGEGMEVTTLPLLFPFNWQTHCVPVGLSGGVCGIALPMYALLNKSYGWLSVFGIAHPAFNNDDDVLIADPKIDAGKNKNIEYAKN